MRLVLLVGLALTVQAQENCEQRCGQNTECVNGECVASCPSSSSCCNQLTTDQSAIECPDVSACVCAFDPFCCSTAWDSQCVAEAVQGCQLNCDSTEYEWVNYVLEVGDLCIGRDVTLEEKKFALGRCEGSQQDYLFEVNRPSLVLMNRDGEEREMPRQTFEYYDATVLNEAEGQSVNWHSYINGAFYGQQINGTVVAGAYVGFQSYASLDTTPKASRFTNFYWATQDNSEPVQRGPSNIGAPIGPFQACMTEPDENGVCSEANIIDPGTVKYSVFGYTLGDQYAQATENEEYWIVRQQLTNFPRNTDLVLNNDKDFDTIGNASVFRMSVGGVTYNFPQTHGIGYVDVKEEVDGLLPISETRSHSIHLTKVPGEEAVNIDYVFPIVPEPGMFLIFDPDVTTECYRAVNRDQTVGSGWKGMGQVKAISDDDCARKCNEQGTCAAWVNEQATDRCWLSSTIATKTAEKRMRTYGTRCPNFFVEWPSCKPSCYVNNGGCPNGVACHQKKGQVYRVNGVCYKALTGCYNCLELGPENFPQDLDPVDCGVSHYGSDDHSVLMKCFVAKKEQQAEGGVSLTQYGSFKWARMYGNNENYNAARMVFTGSILPLTGLFHIKTWNDLYGRELNSAALAQVCEDTFDRRASEDAFFLFARTGCLDEKEIGGIAGQQGNFNRCPYWPNSGGPFISFGTLPAEQTWVTFGDSLSDVATNQWLWYRMGMGASPWYPGVFSNGPIWQSWLAKAMHGKWNAEGRGDTLWPLEGFTSYATGGAVVSQIDAPEDADQSLLDLIKIAVTDPLLGDINDQMHNRDVWAQTYKDPFGVTTSERCSAHGDDCASSNGKCVGTGCGFDGEDCAHYACTCQEGFVVRDNVCTDKTGLTDMPDEFVDGGPFVLFWLGANDLNFPARLSNYDRYLDVNCYSETASDADNYLCADAAINRALDGIMNAMQALYHRGYRNFAYANLPDLGIVPANLGLFTIETLPAPYDGFPLEDDAKCNATLDTCSNARNLYRSRRMTQLTQKYNQLLKERMDAWQEQVTVTVAFVDVFASFTNLLNNKLELFDGSLQDYPFPIDTDRFVTLDGSMDSGEDVKIYKSCYNSMLGWSFSDEDICNDQDRALFWDAVHPSTRTHCWIAYFWQLSVARTGKWPEPDLTKWKDMCGSTQAWHGHVYRTTKEN